MKISKLFHWLYAALMFLPLVVMPIFAIYSHRHTIDSYEVTVSQNEVVDFNQQVENGNFVNDYRTVWYSSNCDFTFADNVATVVARRTGVCSFSSTTKTYLAEHKYYITFETYSSDSEVSVLLSAPLTGSEPSTNATTWTKLTYISSRWSDISASMPQAYIRDAYEGYTFYVRNFMQVDLTQMFGSGNEPSVEQFNVWYSENYYDYTLSTKQLLKNVSTVTYDNSDIGSQFLYSLYITTDKYLNFDEVLSLGAISDWIEQNVFNGNAPLVFTIVWHYLDYWLILSIFWLCFDVLIYVPQIAHRWLDKASLE